MRETAIDLAAALRRRGPVLARLLEAPADGRTLGSEVALSQSTIRRALHDFQDDGLIEAGPDGFALTLVGRLVATVYADFEAAVATVAAQETAGGSLWATDAERTEALRLIADRLDILDCTRTPRDKRTLVENIDYSRSTVDRAIRELELAGFVVRTADGYHTTTLGQRTATQYRTTITTLTDVLAARDLLDRLPADCPFAPALLAGAEIERADDTRPYRLLAGVRHRFETADQLRVVIPAVPNPQLFDYCHQLVSHGTALEFVTAPPLFETLTSEFPGVFAEMTLLSGRFTACIADAPSFGLLLADTKTGPVVSVIVYIEGQAVHGAIHAETTAAVEWAEALYEGIRDTATEITAELREVATAPVARTGVPDPARVDREAEGFVQLTPEYFVERTPAPPATAWRAGFDLVDVHAGYAIDWAIDRDSDDTSEHLTDALLTRLDEGGNHALLGPPGSGKSTICQAVACRWYEQGRGAVFYRESGTGETFDSPAILGAQLRAAAGQTLVVVEDAVRAEANTIFRVMEDFRADPTVVFLLDARTHEWDATPFPPDARLDTYRTEAIETVTMPGLDEYACKRLVERFQETTGHTIDVPVANLLQQDEIEPSNAVEPAYVQASQPAELLLVLHRLTLYADPLAGDDTRTPTTLTEDVQQTYATLQTESELALAVGVLVNLLNVAGLDVQSALVYALAEDDSDVGRVRIALSTLDGHIIFTRENSDTGRGKADREDATSATGYRTVHEAWSELFLAHLLEAAETDRAASERFGRCVSALLALADDTSLRERSTAAVGGDAPVIDRIAATPGEWADVTIERVFQPGPTSWKVAPLFGTTEYPTIELPAVCSPTIIPRCAWWRGDTYLGGGYFNRAHSELTHAIALVDASETSEAADLGEVKASSYRKLGELAFERGDFDAAVEFNAQGRDSYRTIDNQVGEADCLRDLGQVVMAQGDYERAAEYYEQSLTTYREVGAPRKNRGWVLNNLGHIAIRRGDLDRAEEYLDRSIEIGRNGERDWTLGDAYGNLGEVARLRGDFDYAEDCYRQTLAISQDTGIAVLAAFGLLGRGWVALDRDDLGRAAEYIQQGFNIGRKIESLRKKALGCHLLGTLARKDGALGAAETYLTEALELTRDVGDRYREAQTLIELSKLAVARDDQDKAREQFTAAVAIYRELGAVRDAVTSLEQLAETCEALNDHDAALAHSETAIAIANEATFDVPHESSSEQFIRLTADASGNEED